jgi:hypothetical protein
MVEPKTIRGYLSLLNKLEHFLPTTMNGFDELPQEVQDDIKELTLFLSNIMSDINENNLK